MTQIFLKNSFLDTHSPSLIFFSTTYIAVKFHPLCISERPRFTSDTLVLLAGTSSNLIIVGGL